MSMLKRLRARLGWVTPRNLDFVCMQNQQILDRLDRLDKLDDIYARIEQADEGINRNLNHKMDERLFPLLDQMRRVWDARDAHQKMLGWELYRREGESLEAAKSRFFHEIAPAKGTLRLLQLGCAQLLREFDELCCAHKIDYWVAFGTLLGAVRHGGFIPWDDDTDLGMMRGDIDRLADIVKKDGRYRITLVYDNYNKCRQVRFKFADEVLPCFLDLFIYDYAVSDEMQLFDKQETIRMRMIKTMDSDDELQQWRDDGFHEGEDELSRKIEQRFEEARRECCQEGVVSKASREAILWGIDNFSHYSWLCKAEDVFPTRRLYFEGVECNAPNNYMKFLDEVYGDIYSLPDDMLDHIHFLNNELSDPAIAASLKVFEGIDVRE